VSDHQPRIIEVERGGIDIRHHLAAKVLMHPLEVPQRGVVARLQRVVKCGRFALVFVARCRLGQVVADAHALAEGSEPHSNARE